MNALPARPLRDTGPIELRDFGPTGRRLGTAADCYDGSPWELHRGELWEQMGSKDIQRLVRLSRQFFAQGADTKMRIAMTRGGRAWRGYFPVGGELTSGRPDLKEG